MLISTFETIFLQSPEFLFLESPIHKVRLRCTVYGCNFWCHQGLVHKKAYLGRPNVPRGVQCVP